MIRDDFQSGRRQMDQHLVNRLAAALLVVQGLLGLAAVAAVLIDVHGGARDARLIAQTVPTVTQPG